MHLICAILLYPGLGNPLFVPDDTNSSVFPDFQLPAMNVKTENPPMDFMDIPDTMAGTSSKEESFEQSIVKSDVPIKQVSMGSVGNKPESSSTSDLAEESGERPYACSEPGCFKAFKKWVNIVSKKYC